MLVPASVSDVDYIFTDLILMQYILQAEIIVYGSKGELFMEHLCFTEGDYSIVPIFIGSPAILGEAKHIYASGLQVKNNQQCVEPAGVFVHTPLSQYNSTACFDDDLETPCTGTCTNTFTARSCDISFVETSPPVSFSVDIEAKTTSGAEVLRTLYLSLITVLSLELTNFW